MDIFVVNPQLDTPENFVIVAFLFAFAIWSAIYTSNQNKKLNEDKK